METNLAEAPVRHKTAGALGRDSSCNADVLGREEPMKASQFRIAAEIKPDKHDWGLGRWISHPLSTGPKQLTVLDAIIMPGATISINTPIRRRFFLLSPAISNNGLTGRSGF
jgi:hypothetical protein